MIGNPQTLPGTVLESGPGALETFQAVVPIHLQRAKQVAERAAAKAKDDAEKAKELTGMEITPVAEWDVPEYSAAVSAWRDNAADKLKKFRMNPNDPSLDPTNPMSPAYRELKEAEDAIKQFSFISNNNLKGLAETIKTYSPQTDNPDDLKAAIEYYQAPVTKHLSGEAKPPILVGNYDMEAVYNEQVNKLLQDQTAYANNNEPGYISKGTTKTLSKAKVQEMAYNLAKPFSGNRHYEAKRRELARLAESSPEQYAALEKEAAANGVSVEQWSAWKDVEKKQATVKTAEMGADATFNQGMGSGWKNEEESSQWWADRSVALAEGDMSTLRPMKITRPAGTAKGAPYHSGAMKDDVTKAIKAAGIEGVNEEAVYNAWMEAGEPAEFHITTDFANFPMKKEQVMMGDTPKEILIKPTAVVATKRPDGKYNYTYVQEPDLSKIEGKTEREEIRKKVQPKFHTVPQEEVLTYQWSTQTTTGNKAINTTVAKKRLNEKGQTYEQTNGLWVGEGEAPNTGTTAAPTGYRGPRPTQK